MKGIITEIIPNENIKIQTTDGNIFVFKNDEIEKITKNVISDSAYSQQISSKIVNQTEKSYKIIGGEVYYYEQSTKYGTYANYFKFSPSVSLFVDKNVLIGISLSYEVVSGTFVNSNQLSITPIIRYYFGNKATKPFAHLSFSYFTQKYNPNMISIGLGLGYNIAISQDVSIVPIVEYNLRSANSGTLGDEKIFFTGVGFNFFFF